MNDFLLKPNTPFVRSENSYGLLSMRHGLEYHYSNHLKIEQEAQEYYHKIMCMTLFGQKKIISSNFNIQYASHEAIAYINCLGQIYFFFQAPWLHDLICVCGSKKMCGKWKKVLAGKIKTICALMPIRNKFTAHREQDSPRCDDMKSLGLNRIGLQPCFGGSIGGVGKIQYNWPTKQRCKELPKESVKNLEYIHSNNNVIQFVLTDQHSKIMSEIEVVVRFVNKVSLR